MEASKQANNCLHACSPARPAWESSFPGAPDVDAGFGRSCSRDETRHGHRHKGRGCQGGRSSSRHDTHHALNEAQRECERRVLSRHGHTLCSPSEWRVSFGPRAVGHSHLAHVPLGFVIWPTCRWASRAAHRGRCTAHRGVPPSFASSRPGCETGR